MSLGRDVLLVEANRLLAQLLQTTLAPLDCHVRHARTLREALRHLELRAPTLVVIDEDLPDGSGEEVLRRIRAFDAPPPPVVLLRTTMQAALEDGAPRRLITVLRKPIALTEFAALVRQRLDGAQAPIDDSERERADEWLEDLDRAARSADVDDDLAYEDDLQ